MSLSLTLPIDQNPGQWSFYKNPRNNDSRVSRAWKMAERRAEGGREKDFSVYDGTIFAGGCRGEEEARETFLSPRRCIFRVTPLRHEETSKTLEERGGEVWSFGGNRATGVRMALSSDFLFLQ